MIEDCINFFNNGRDGCKNGYHEDFCNNQCSDYESIKDSLKEILKPKDYNDGTCQHCKLLKSVDLLKKDNEELKKEIKAFLIALDWIKWTFDIIKQNTEKMEKNK